MAFGNEIRTGSSGQSTGFYNGVVSTSARFRTADASSLSLTQNTNDPSDSTKGTLSFWLKRSNIGANPSNNNHYLFVTSSGTDDDGWKALGIANDDELFLAD